MSKIKDFMNNVINNFEFAQFKTDLLADVPEGHLRDDEGLENPNENGNYISLNVIGEETNFINIVNSGNVLTNSKSINIILSCREALIIQSYMVNKVAMEITKIILFYLPINVEVMTSHDCFIQR